MKKYTFVLAFLTFATSSCNFLVNKPGNDQGGVNGLDTRLGHAVSFRVLSERVLQQNNCVGCHNASSAPKGVDLSSYQAIISNHTLVNPGHPETSALIQSLLASENPRMPLGGAPLSDNAIKVVSNWIQNGAREEGTDSSSDLPSDGGTEPPPAPIPSDAPPVLIRVTYEMVRDQVLQPSCSHCHGIDHPAAGLNVLTYAAITADSDVVKPGAASNSELYTRLLPGALPRPMPPQGVLSDDKVALVKQWIDQGATSETSPAPSNRPAPEPSSVPVPAPSLAPELPGPIAIPPVIVAVPVIATPPVIVVPPVVAVPTPTLARISFTDVTTRVLQSKCLGCHSGSYAFDMTTFAAMQSVPGLLVPGSPESSKLYTSLLSGAVDPMPKFGQPLDSGDVQFIKDWISQGAPEVIH